MSEPLKKKLFAGKIELDPAEPVIVVNYATVLKRGAEEVKRTPGSQRIKLKTFGASSDVDKMASMIVSKCKYIHSSKLDHVRRLLLALKARVSSGSGGADRSQSARPAAKRGNGGGGVDRKRGAATRGGTRPASSSSRVSIRPVKRALKPVVIRQTRPANMTEAARQQLAQEAQKKKEAAVAAAAAAAEEQERKRREEDAAAAAAAPVATEPAAAATLVARPGDGKSRMGGDGKQPSSQRRQREKGTSRRPRRARRKKMRRAPRRRKNLPKASMDKLESYHEQLYEDDIQEKIKGTACILQLVQNAENIDTFVQQRAILRTLGRELKDNLKKDTELLINILQIFFCFSSFYQLHNLLLDNKVEQSTIKIIQLEAKRYQHRVASWKQPSGGGGDAAATAREEELAAGLHKQEHLLYISYYILLNLAENTTVQVQLIEKQLLRRLLEEFRRQDSRSRIRGTDIKMTDDLLQLVVIFLKTLSIFEENVRDMGRMGAVRRLQELYSSTSHEDLRDEILQLLFNLSFDKKQRQLCTNNAFLAHVVEALKKPVTRHNATKLLYHITLDAGEGKTTKEDRKHLEAATKVVVGLILHCEQSLVEEHLISLGVNLVCDLGCAKAVVSKGNVLAQLLKRAHSTWDSLLMKMVRNVSDHQQLWANFAPHMHQLVGMCMRAQNHDFLVEALSTLSNVQLPTVLYHQLLIRHNFLNPLVAYLNPGFAKDDVVLAVIMVLGTFALDAKCAALMSSRPILQKLFGVVQNKIQDEDMVLQTMFTMYRICLHKAGREAVAAGEELVACLLDLMGDQSPEIRSMASEVLDLVVQSDKEGWQEKIREKRFEGMNHSWIAFMERAEEGGAVDYGPPDEDDGAYYDEQDPNQVQMWGDGYDEDVGEEFVNEAQGGGEYGSSVDDYEGSYEDGGAVMMARAMQ